MAVGKRKHDDTRMSLYPHKVEDVLRKVLRIKPAEMPSDVEIEDRGSGHYVVTMDGASHDVQILQESERNYWRLGTDKSSHGYATSEHALVAAIKRLGETG